MVVPMLANTTQAMDTHCKKDSFSCRNINPDKAANAGCKLVKILKVLAGSLFKAIKSSEKGSALENMATPSPNKKTEPLLFKIAPSHKAKGMMNRKAKSMPVVTASLPGNTLAT